MADFPLNIFHYYNRMLIPNSGHMTFRVRINSILNQKDSEINYKLNTREKILSKTCSTVFITLPQCCARKTNISSGFTLLIKSCVVAFDLIRRDAHPDSQELWDLNFCKQSWRDAVTELLLLRQGERIGILVAHWGWHKGA